MPGGADRPSAPARFIFKQLRSRTGPLGDVTSYTYNPNGNLGSLTDLLNHTTSLVYNG